jgi:hypothetical protein
LVYQAITLTILVIKEDNGITDTNLIYELVAHACGKEELIQGIVFVLLTQYKHYLITFSEGNVINNKNNSRVV